LFYENWNSYIQESPPVLVTCVNLSVAARGTYIRAEGKVKAIPLQAWTDPEGSRRLRLLYFWLKVGLPYD